MKSFWKSPFFYNLLRIFIASVWIFHGLYSKVFNGIPRHGLIISRILGENLAEPARWGIGLAEIVLGLWVFSGYRRSWCASLQTLALISMNTLEIIFARDLLISPFGMVALNLAFISAIWYWARFPKSQLNPAKLDESASCV